MIEITNAEAGANITRFAEEGRLVQHDWHSRDKQGRELACLLGSIHSEVESAKDCNAALMPLWLAETTVTLFDLLPHSEIVPVALRYGSLIARWDQLGAAQWDAILTRFLVRCIDDAVEAARPAADRKRFWPAVVEACAACRDAIERGDKRAAADAAARAAGAARAAAWAAGAAVWAAGAADAAASAARAAGAGAGAAGAAAEAARAAWAAEAAEAAWVADSAADSAAGAAEAAALFNFLLDRIEADLA